MVECSRQLMLRVFCSMLSQLVPRCVIHHILYYKIFCKLWISLKIYCPASRRGVTDAPLTLCHGHAFFGAGALTLEMAATTLTMAMMSTWAAGSGILGTGSGAHNGWSMRLWWLGRKGGILPIVTMWWHRWGHRRDNCDGMDNVGDNCNTHAFWCSYWGFKMVSLNIFLSGYIDIIFCFIFKTGQHRCRATEAANVPLAWSSRSSHSRLPHWLQLSPESHTLVRARTTIKILACRQSNRFRIIYVLSQFCSRI